MANAFGIDCELIFQPSEMYRHPQGLPMIPSFRSLIYELNMLNLRSSVN